MTKARKFSVDKWMELLSFNRESIGILKEDRAVVGLSITLEGKYRPLVYADIDAKDGRQKVVDRTKALEQRGWKRIGEISVFPLKEPLVIVQVMECTRQQYQESRQYKKEK